QQIAVRDQRLQETAERGSLLAGNAQQLHELAGGGGMVRPLAHPAEDLLAIQHTRTLYRRPRTWLMSADLPPFAGAQGAPSLPATLGYAAAMGGTETPIHRFDGAPVVAERIDREAKRMMREARVQGFAMAVVEDGQVAFVRSWGHRNVAANLPLQPDTIMYGASLTKFVFAYMVMQLVDEGALDLDRSIAAYLPRPL